jgi:hypothetical protein
VEAVSAKRPLPQSAGTAFRFLAQNPGLPERKIHHGHEGRSSQHNNQNELAVFSAVFFRFVLSRKLLFDGHDLRKFVGFNNYGWWTLDIGR